MRKSFNEKSGAGGIRTHASSKVAYEIMSYKSEAGDIF